MVKLTGNNYSSIFIIGPIFMAAAFAMVFGMHDGEGKAPVEVNGSAAPKQN
jgi:hypothetical protein